MKPVLIQLEDALVASIDAARGDVPRTVWIRRSIEERLAGRSEPADPAAVAALTLATLEPPEIDVVAVGRELLLNRPRKAKPSKAEAKRERALDRKIESGKVFKAKPKGRVVGYDMDGKPIYR